MEVGSRVALLADHRDVARVADRNAVGPLAQVAKAGDLEGALRIGTYRDRHKAEGVLADRDLGADQGLSGLGVENPALQGDAGNEPEVDRERAARLHAQPLLRIGDRAG